MKASRLIFLFAAGVAASHASAVVSSSETYRFVNTATRWSGGNQFATDPDGWVTRATSESVGYNGLSGTVSVGGMAEYGLAKSFASGSGAGYYGLGQSGWVDRLTFTDTARTGQHGFVTVAVKYNWTLDYNEKAPVEVGSRVTVRAGNADAIAGQTPNVNCYTQFGCSTYHSSSITTWGLEGATASVTGSVNASGATGTLLAKMPITFGQTQTWQVSLSANAGYNQLDNWTLSVSQGSAFADHSLQWGGIVGVFDEAGNPVGAYGLASASGFDYRKAYVPAVPEPATSVLWALGIAASVIAARRRGCGASAERS